MKRNKNIIKLKIELNIPKPLTTLCGTSKKKDAIVKAIATAMKPSSKLFWQNLHTNLNAPDILDEEY